jgi:hypothetical protein
MSIHQSTSLGGNEKLVVSPRCAAEMLDSGVTYVYELLSAGLLQSYREGRHRKVLVQSIRDHIARRLAEPEPEISPMAKATAASLASRGYLDPPSAA